MSEVHILVVEDDALIAQVAVDALRAAGYITEAVEDGRQALHALKLRRSDLILLDANMPVMDGFEALDAIRRDHTLRHVPVIMLTALRRADDVVRATALGADDYILKPFDAGMLLTRVKALLRKRADQPSDWRLGPVSESKENGPAATDPSSEVQLID